MPVARVSLPERRFAYQTKGGRLNSFIQSVRSASAIVSAPEFVAGGTAAQPCRCAGDDAGETWRAPAPDGAFPHGQHAPAGPLKLLPHLGVTLPVARDLRGPEIAARVGKAKERAVVAVPKTAIHENGRAIAGKRLSGFPGTSRG